MNYKYLICILLSLALLPSCSMAPKREIIPPVCKSQYEYVPPRVGVVSLTNHAVLNLTDAKTASEGITWDQGVTEEQRKSAIEKQQNMLGEKLVGSIDDAVINELVNTGGAEVYTRNELQKIMDEHKLQRSGLIDETTLARFGKLAGAQYVVTGSVNNVNLYFRSFATLKEKMDKAGDKSAGLTKKTLKALGAIGKMVVESQEGWNINVDVTVRMIDVASGEITFAEKAAGSYFIPNRIPLQQYEDTMQNGVRKAADNGLGKLRSALAKRFPLKGYIIQIKDKPDDSKQKMVQINIGRNVGLKAGTEFTVYTFRELDDTVHDKKVCSVEALPVILRTDDHSRADMAWTSVKGKPETARLLKLDQLVEKKP